MTPGIIDDSISLRFHLARSMRSSHYTMEKAHSPLSFLWASTWWCLVMLAGGALATYLAFQAGLLSIPVLTLPVILAWRSVTRGRRISADLERSSLWRYAAHEIARHIDREPREVHGSDVLRELMRIRIDARSLRHRDVAAVLVLSTATTMRNRILVLSYLQLTLLSHAERMRVDAIYDSDVLDDDERRRIMASIRRMPHRGRRPISLETYRCSATTSA